MTPANASAIWQLAGLAGVQFEPAPGKRDRLASAVHEAGLIADPERTGALVLAAAGEADRRTARRDGAVRHGGLCRCVACVAINAREFKGDAPPDADFSGYMGANATGRSARRQRKQKRSKRRGY